MSLGAKYASVQSCPSFLSDLSTKFNSKYALLASLNAFILPKQNNHLSENTEMNRC